MKTKSKCCRAYAQGKYDQLIFRGELRKINEFPDDRFIRFCPWKVYCR